jgi:hypothetical protein
MPAKAPTPPPTAAPIPAPRPPPAIAPITAPVPAPTRPLPNARSAGLYGSAPRCLGTLAQPRLRWRQSIAFSFADLATLAR